MNKKDEKRRHDRFSAEDVSGSFSFTVEASVINISLGGLAVRTQTQLKVGREYRFRMGGEEDAVQLSGTVRWCRLSGTERQESGDVVPVYEAGISFDDVLTEKADQLVRFMEQNIVLDLKRRITGRFKLDASDPVQLETDAGFEVKQISLAGMMLESDLALKPDTMLELEMRLKRRKFTSLARIIYVSEISLEEGELKYRVGLEFIDTAPKMRALLEEFIRTELDSEGEINVTSS